MKLNLAGLLAALFLVAGCSTPQPPKCDGTDRHPINGVQQTASTVAPIDKCSRG